MDRRSFVVGAAALPFALGVAGARAGLLGGTPLALVTADLESAVVAVELTTGQVVRRLATLPGPRSIESVLAGSAVVAHTAEGALSVIDGRSLRVRHVVHGLAEPRYTAVGRTGRHAYVTDSERGEVAVVDVVRGAVVARVPVGGPARHLSLSPSGGRLWVALGSKAEELAVLDVRRPAAPRLVARLRPPFLAHDVGFAPDGRSAWVSSGASNEVAAYDARTRRLRFRIAAGAPPQHVTFIGERAYVASGDDGTVRVHRLEDGRLLKATRVPEGSYNVQQGWGRVLTPSLSQGTLCVLSRGGEVAYEVVAARSSHDACFVMGL